MRSKLVLAGRFRVFEDGHVNRVTKSGEMDAPISMVGKARKYAQVSFARTEKQKRFMFIALSPPRLSQTLTTYQR